MRGDKSESTARGEAIRVSFKDEEELKVIHPAVAAVTGRRRPSWSRKRQVTPAPAGLP